VIRSHDDILLPFWREAVTAVDERASWMVTTTTLSSGSMKT
jgi:hypothetical protein